MAEVTVYSLRGCPHCVRARGLLKRRGIAFTEDVAQTKDRDRLEVLTGGWTYPQVVIDGRTVGGADELARLDRAGVLVPLARGEQFPIEVRQRRLDLVAWLRREHPSPWTEHTRLVGPDGRAPEPAGSE